MQYPYKILVLDDDKLVTDSLKSLFWVEDFCDVAFFNVPKEALDYLKKEERDVIISDFMMNDMNGIEFLTEAKKLHPNAETILLTGYADKENAIKAVNEVGVYKYIEKPWDNDDLIINIKNAYEKSTLVKTLEEKNKKLKEYSENLEEIVKEKTADLFEANERLSAVILNCADSIITVSTSKDILSVNPACEILSGLSAEIIKTKKVDELFNFKDTDINSVLKKDSHSLLREVEIENAVNGRKIPVEISCSYIPATESQKDANYVFAIRDITARQEAERLREDFIATLTHDLRTPALAAIRTLEYFLNGKIDDITEKQKMFLCNLKKSNEDMLGLVNTLLEVYKYEAGHLKPVKTPFDFVNLIEECIEMVLPLAEEKNIVIKKSYGTLNNYEINADRAEIRRVIVNLLGNAVKYTQEGGEAEVKAYTESNDLYFSVKDNGSGILKQDIPKLFKRFSQGTKEKRSISTGLGLYLSKQIIDAHGGKIWLESDKGKGSEFFFLLQDSVTQKETEKV